MVTRKKKRKNLGKTIYGVTHHDDGYDRLEHYNKWLLDPKRPLAEIYPGYPGDDNGTKSKKRRTND